MNETTRYSLQRSSDTILFTIDTKPIEPDIIDNPTAISSILVQVMSALDEYPSEKRQLDQHFQPYVCLTEPNGKRFLFGRIVGSWNSDFNEYSIDEIKLHSVFETIDDLTNNDAIIKLRESGVPILSSELFRTAADAAGNQK